MDPIRNPFSPGAGAPPYELFGREEVLDQARILLGRVAQGRPEKSLLLTGLRGVGKTVLLNEIGNMATERHKYKIALIEAHEEKSLAALLIPDIRKMFFQLDRLSGAGHKVRRGFAVLKGFVSSVRLSWGGFEVGLDIDPELGTADTGDIQIDLPNLLAVLAEAAEERGVGVALLIDEIQYLKPQELSALIMSMHRMQQRRLPLVLIGAGLPILPALAGDSKSYAERLFLFPIIGALPDADARRALQDPVKAEDPDVCFSEDALAEIISLTQGYPYFLQEWGYQAWNFAETGEISLSLIQQVTDRVVLRLDQNFFRVRFDRLTPREKEYLYVMASLGAGPHRSGDVATSRGVPLSALAKVRDNLIKKGMIYSPRHGEMAFTVPLFDQFMLREMPRGFSS